MYNDFTDPMREKKQKLFFAAEALICEMERVNSSLAMPSYLELQDFRRRKGFSIREVAEKTGISAATISRIERGGDAGHDNWIRLCNFYSNLLG